MNAVSGTASSKPITPHNQPQKRIPIVAATGLHRVTVYRYAAGKVTAVGISYPRDFVRQQLSYAAMYGVQ